MNCQLFVQWFWGSRATIPFFGALALPLSAFDDADRVDGSSRDYNSCFDDGFCGDNGEKYREIRQRR